METKSTIPERIEWECAVCGRKFTNLAKMGPPHGGMCPRAGKNPNGIRGPHRWVKRRVLK